MAINLFPQQELDPLSQQIQTGIGGPIPGLPPILSQPGNGGGIMGALRGIGQKIRSVDPATWAMIAGGIGSARGGSPIGNVASGISQGLGQAQAFKSLKEKAQERQEARAERKFAGDELSKSITEALKNLDTDADGVVTAQEQERGNILRAALPIARLDPTRASEMVAEASNMLVPTEDTRPSNVREWEEYNALSPEDQKRYLDMKRAGYGFDVGGATNYRTAGGDIETLSTAGQAGGNEAIANQIVAADEAKTQFKLSFPGLMTNARASRDLLVGIAKEIEGLPTGPGSEAVMTKINAKYQAAEAQLKQAALENIAALAQKGVKLNPVTEEELRILLSTSPSLTNYPEANKQILEKRIAMFENVMKDLEDQMSFYEKGGNPLDYKGRTREEPKTEPKAEQSDGWGIVRE